MNNLEKRELRTLMLPFVIADIEDFRKQYPASELPVKLLLEIIRRAMGIALLVIGETERRVNQ